MTPTALYKKVLASIRSTFALLGFVFFQMPFHGLISEIEILIANILALSVYIIVLIIIWVKRK